MRYHVMCPGALGDSSWLVRSQDGSVSYQVADKNWAADRAFALLDARSVVVAEGRMRNTWRHRVCDLYRGGELAAHISTSVLRDIRTSFVGEMPAPDRLYLEGDFPEQQYSFFRCSRSVAVVSTVWDESDECGFGVEIRRGEDHVTILAATLAIRALCGERPRTRIIARPAWQGVQASVPQRAAV